jgi:hypothetical protein
VIPKYPGDDPGGSDSDPGNPEGDSESPNGQMPERTGNKERERTKGLEIKQCNPKKAQGKQEQDGNQRNTERDK